MAPAHITDPGFRNIYIPASGHLDIDRIRKEACLQGLTAIIGGKREIQPAATAYRAGAEADFGHKQRRRRCAPGAGIGADPDIVEAGRRTLDLDTRIERPFAPVIIAEPIAPRVIDDQRGIGLRHCGYEKVKRTGRIIDIEVRCAGDIAPADSTAIHRDGNTAPGPELNAVRIRQETGIQRDGAIARRL